MRLLFNKKGVSDIVAVVLVILIVVASVFILWMGVRIFFSEDFGSVEPDVRIVEGEGYSVFDSSNGWASVQVERRNDVEFEKLKFVFYYDGKDSVEFYEEDLLEVGNKKLYKFDLTSEEAGDCESAEDCCSEEDYGCLWPDEVEVFVE